MTQLTTNYETLFATRNYAAVKRGELPDTFPKGRVCLEDGCITTLSIYNGGPWCWCHTGRHRAELLAADDTVTFYCGACGEVVHDDCQRPDCVLRP